MNNRFSKVVVLAVSATLGACYIWYMSDKNKPSTMPTENAAEKQVQTETPNEQRTVLHPTVTDEEVKRARESMLKSSKSGLIMSDDQIRAMLETQKKNSLLPSTKNPTRLVSPEDIKQAVEPPKNLLPSSKMAPAFDSEDVKVTRDTIDDFLNKRANEKK